jgi:spore germination protein GerM
MLDKKRVLIVGIAIILIVAIIAVVYFFIKNKEEDNEITEYTPQEEISEEQMRQTMVALYFKNENGLMPEARLIDVKELIENPYEKILNMLIEGPKNENLQKTIPEGTKINKIEKDGENLIIDFSEEFILNNNEGEQEEKLTLQSIIKTVTELTEINGIKIKINGEENKEFKDGKIKFNQIFNRDF